jgi:predicted RNA-binding protein YlqC (UPF0109 family)
MVVKMSNSAHWIDLVSFVLKSYVKEPDAVDVEYRSRSFHNGSRGVLRITVSQQDRALVIGKGGRNLDALRTLLKLNSPTDDLPRLEVRDPE